MPSLRISRDSRSVRKGNLKLRLNVFRGSAMAEASQIPLTSKVLKR